MFTTTYGARGRRLAVCLAAVLAVALSVIAGLVGSPAPARADGHDWDILLPAPGTCGPAEDDPNASTIEQRKAGMCLANAVRQNFSRGRLGPEPSGLGLAVLAAYFKARDVGNCQRDPVHTACRGRGSEASWIKRYDFRRACPDRWAENIYAGGSGGFNTAREAVRWWVNSDRGHRDALLDPRFTKQGMNLYRVPGIYHGPGTPPEGYRQTQVWVHYLCG